MSINSIEKIKQAQSSLKSERKPVSHVQEAMTHAKKITQFVQTALNKENRWIFQSGEQESIVSMLNEINKTNKELYEKCRTPEHFNRDVGRFIKMKKDVIRKSNCIHLSLDQGFYNTEPLGFSPSIAVELSAKKIQTIREGLRQGRWVLSPIEATADEQTKKDVEKLFSESVPLSEKISKNDNFKSFEPPLNIEELQTLYKYFQIVKSILDFENQAIKTTLSKKSIPKIFSQDEILGKLSEFQKNINAVKFPPSNIFPDWSLELYKISITDLNLRMHLIRIPLEPLVFQKRLLKKVEEQKKLSGIEESITNLHNSANSELKQLQLFIDIFIEIDKTFREVTGILQNLSISFGKIYHNASSQTITREFLIKVLGLIQGMLEKGIVVAKSKTQKLDELQLKVRDIELFDPSIIKGILYAIELLNHGQEEMNQFCEQINSFLESISIDSSGNSMKTYKLLKNAYEESTNLTSASMIFGSVTNTSVLLKDSITEVKSILQELVKLRENNIDSEKLYQETISILETERKLPQDNIKKRTENVEELNWLLTEMLGDNIKEELRFVNELQKELKPIFERINTRKLKEEAQKLEKQKEIKTSPRVNLQKNITKQKAKSVPKSNQNPIGGKKSVYDPFEPFEMVAIKDACRNMTSSEGKMIYHVLTNTHTFFTLLNKMENTFKHGEGLENELIQDIEKSKTTHEFLNNFARLKFLPHGYYNNNNAPFDYNKEKRRFIVPAGIEKQLRLSDTSISTPMEAYRRIIRVLLGFDEPKTLSTIMPQQVLSILEEDFMLKTKDRRLVEEKLGST